MGEQNGAKWKDEGLDCLVLDEFLIPNPKNSINISETNVNSESVKNEEETVSKPDQVIFLEPNILSSAIYLLSLFALLVINSMVEFLAFRMETAQRVKKTKTKGVIRNVLHQ